MNILHKILMLNKFKNIGEMHVEILVKTFLNFIIFSKFIFFNLEVKESNEDKSLI